MTPKLIMDSSKNRWKANPFQQIQGFHPGVVIFQMILACSTDTEKQVDVLQAENDQLLQELTEAKNAHTKAVTVSKLGNHRQQVILQLLRKYVTYTRLISNLKKVL